MPGFGAHRPCVQYNPPTPPLGRFCDNQGPSCDKPGRSRPTPIPPIQPRRAVPDPTRPENGGKRAASSEHPTATHPGRLQTRSRPTRAGSRPSPTSLDPSATSLDPSHKNFGRPTRLSPPVHTCCTPNGSRLEQHHTNLALDAPRLGLPRTSLHPTSNSSRPTNKSGEQSASDREHVQMTLGLISGGQS
jgi:hypothetical protein